MMAEAIPLSTGKQLWPGILDESVPLGYDCATLAAIPALDYHYIRRLRWGEMTAANFFGGSLHRAVAERILAEGRYAATPGPHCARCAFERICPSAWTREQHDDG
jgi:hypothetical protein